MNDFEKYTKDILNDHPSPVDTEPLWANIDRELRPGKHRFAPFWLWGLGLAVVVVTGGIMFVLHHQKNISQTPASGQNVVASKTGEVPKPYYSPRRHVGTEEEADRGFVPSWQTQIGRAHV